MGNVYKKATKVCCWLEEELPNDAINFIHDMSEAHAKLLSQQNKGKRIPQQTGKGPAVLPFDIPHVDELVVPWVVTETMHLLLRKYLSRIRTAQEMSLGRRAVVCCGHESADWDGSNEHFPRWLSGYIEKVLLKTHTNTHSSQSPSSPSHCSGPAASAAPSAPLPKISTMRPPSPVSLFPPRHRSPVLLRPGSPRRQPLLHDLR